MRVTSFVYDSAESDPHVSRVVDLIESREESVDVLDVAAAEDSDAARREAMLTVKGAVRIGSPPDAIFDDAGQPDFSAGVLITEAATGRRSLHVGTDALDALRDA